MSAWRRPARRLVERLLDHEIRQDIDRLNAQWEARGPFGNSIGIGQSMPPVKLTPAALGGMRFSFAARNRFRGIPRRRR